MRAIETTRLSKRFGERTAVDGLALSVDQGEIFALLGVNGAGKTTTIKMLCCLLPPTSGDAVILGKSIVKEPLEVKKVHNISPQETAVAPNLTLRENLAFMAEIYGADKAAAQRRADDMLAAFSLTERGNDKAKTLSGGMQRRLSIAMALITEPKVLFLDEPTLGLDVRARRELWRVIEKLKGTVTILLTTHYLEEAQALSDRIGIMHEGKLRAVGTPEEIIKRGGGKDIEEAFLALTDAEAER